MTGCVVAWQENCDQALHAMILLAITSEPGLDDVEIARKIGAIPYVVSTALREMERRGLVVRRA